MDLENVFLILGMCVMLAGIFLVFGLGVSLISGGVMLVCLAFLLARSNAVTGYLERKRNGKTTQSNQ